MRRLWPLLAVSLLAGCAGTPKKPPGAAVGQPGPGAVVADGRLPPDCSDFTPYARAVEDPSTRGDYVAGGLYKPGVRDTTPDYLPRVDCIAEPVVAQEPRSAYGNRSPYQVLGRSYVVLDRVDGFVETGLASYYGNKFHGRRTSNHEVYDMYAFTAAHKSLPLPSFARVTNLENGRSVVVRVNDRGPFHEGRVIDLSYAAAVKLDIHRRGTGRVEVRALRPGEGPATLSAATAVPAPAPTMAPAAATPAAASGMDSLVGALPRTVAVAAPASGPVPTPPPATDAAHGVAHRPGYGLEENRFRLVDENGRVRTADEFDAWMRERQARIDAAAANAQAAPAAAVAASTVATTPVPVSPAPVAARPVPTGTGVTLQVGVFSVRDNAERALATLRGAGIAAAQLQDVVSAGRTLWRVRVGPVEAGTIAELSSRVAGLGFGAPQIVRE